MTKSNVVPINRVGPDSVERIKRSRAMKKAWKTRKKNKANAKRSKTMKRRYKQRTKQETNPNMVIFKGKPESIRLLSKVAAELGCTAYNVAT